MTTTAAATEESTRRSAWRPHAPMLAALLGYLVIRGTVMLNGYLYADDFAIRWWAHDSSLTPDYIFRSYYGHVQPWGMIAQWLLQAGWPGSWTALMAWALIMQVAILVLLWRLVHHLTGSNLAAFIAFLVPALSSFTFEVGVWWCMIIESAPYGLFMLLSLWSLVKALEGRPGRWWLWSALTFCAAIMAISRGSLMLLAMILVAAYLPIGASQPRGLLAAFRLNRGYWIGIAAFAVGWIAFLQVYSPFIRSPEWHWSWALRYARDFFLLNVVNGAVGGPWLWFSAPGETWNGVLVIPRQTPWLLAVGVLVAVAGALLVKRFRPALLRYYLGLLVYAAGLAAVAAYGRGGGTLIASSGYRYSSDFWIPLSLFLGLLFFPVLGERDPFSAKAKALRVSRTTVAAVAAAVFAASCLISSIEPSLRWVNSQTKDYVHTAQASMSAIPAEAEFLPQKTMTDLVHPILMLPFASTEVVFAPDPVFRPFVKYSTGGLYGFARDGRAEQQWVAGVSSVAPLGTCGYRLASAPVDIPMAQPVLQWSYVAEVSYLSASDTTMRMRIGPDTHDIPVRAGLHNVFFEVWGPATSVTAELTDPASNVCIDRVTIGPRTGQSSFEQIFPAPADALR